MTKTHNASYTFERLLLFEAVVVAFVVHELLVVQMNDFLADAVVQREGD